MMAENLSGQKFGRLTVVSMNGKIGRNSLWLCRCECDTTKTVRGTYLKTGHTTSCGCLSRELITKKNKHHGHAVRGHRTPEYRSWGAMIRRCHVEKDGKFSDYGARGIMVCERWRVSFEAFLQDVGRKPSPVHTLDRIDNDGNYEPGNVRWAAPLTQANNQRKNLTFTIDGRTQTLAEWVRERGVDYSAAYRQIKNGLDIEAALRPGGGK